MEYKSDIEIAQSAEMFPISKIAEKVGLSEENIEYYGYGPFESEIDFKEQCTVGIFKTTVNDMDERYIKPQDYGTRTGVRWLKVTDDKGVGLMICNADRKLSFNARHFTQKLLQDAKHREDLHNENTTVLNIDGFRRGTGTNSCGPDVLDQYNIDARKGLEFEFTVAPVKNK